MLMSDIKQILDTVLQEPGKELRRGNIAYHCPFCHHRKRKLEVNIKIQHWHCWTCNTAGRKITSLLRKLKSSKDLIQRVATIYKDTAHVKFDDDEYETPILPSEFRPLYKKRNTPDYRNAINYLFNRGVTAIDIVRYNIGYCETGRYAQKIIIPSYDASGQLNFFTSRAFYKHDRQKYINPYSNKNIIGFELFVNWNEPIILCEGVFDAIAIGDNAIPLFGKQVLSYLYRKIIVNSDVIYVMLDPDAKGDAIKIAKEFMGSGIDVYLVNLPHGEDPSSLGHTRVREFINSATLYSESNMLEDEIINILYAGK